MPFTALVTPFFTGGGGDSPEGTTQALWMAATGQPYSVYKGPSPWAFTGAACPAP